LKINSILKVERELTIEVDLSYNFSC
jgi:hypothetical protein